MPAGGAVGGWNRPGPTANPPTGAATATPAPPAPAPAGAKNAYVREDQILPHLAALAILLGGGDQAKGPGAMQLTGPAETADLIHQLRTAGITLTYDPDTQAIRTRGNDPLAVAVGRGR